MNEYKFINAEKLAIEIKTILQDQIEKLNLPSEFVEANLTDDCLNEYVEMCLGDADARMNVILHDVDKYKSTVRYRLDMAYNKYVTGVATHDPSFLKIFVSNLDNEFIGSETVLDLLFLNKWYLENFAEETIIFPFVCRLEYLSGCHHSATEEEKIMDIIDFKKGGNEGALFILDQKNYSACTAVESSRKFKTLKGAIAWLNKRGYREA